MKDWIRTYNSGKIPKFQEGGAMPPPPGPGGPEAGGPPPGGGGGDLEAMLAEYAQSRDPQLAVAICDMLVEMMMAEGGGAPGEGGPPPGGPGGPPPGGPPPMARRGMKLRRGPVFKK